MYHMIQIILQIIQIRYSFIDDDDDDDDDNDYDDDDDDDDDNDDRFLATYTVT